MNRLLQNPHYFFYGFAGLFLLLGWIVSDDATFDFNIYDTYFVIARGFVYFGFTILLLVIGIFYHLITYTWEVLTPSLVRWHILITLLGPVITFILMLLEKEEMGPGGYDRDNMTFNAYIEAGLTILIPLGLFVIISLLPVNVLWSFWKAWRKRKS